METVYFANSQGIRRAIGEASTKEEVFDIINNFLKEHNYKSYYTRIIDHSTEYMLDVGSYTEFFYVGKGIALMGESDGN